MLNLKAEEHFIVELFTKGNYIFPNKQNEKKY